MNEFSSGELIESIDSVISKNRSSLTESDLLALRECKKRLKELDDLKTKENYDLRNQLITEVVSILLRFFFLDS